MARNVAIALAVGWLVVGIGEANRIQAALGQPPAPASSLQDAAKTSEPQQALVQRYCVGCHNDRTKAGGLVLNPANLADPGAHAETLEKVVRKLRVGMMPPVGSARPPKEEYEAFRTWLESSLDRAAAVRAAPQPAGQAHRLNRAEYQNAISDLLAVDVDASTLLPADDSSYGFDNIADVLRMSPTLMESYLTAARKIARLAVGATPPAPNLDLFRIAEDVPQDEHIDGLPFGTRGGTLIRYHFPVDGEYLVKVRLARMMAPNDMDLPTYVRPQIVEVSLDGERVKVFTLPPGKGPQMARAGTTSTGPESAAPRAATSGGSNAASLSPDPFAGSDPAKTPEQNTAPLYGTGGKPSADANWDIRFPVKAGRRTLVVTFLNREPLPELLVEPYLRPFPAGGNMWTPRRGAYIRTVEVSGPFSTAGAGSTKSRQKVFACYPEKPSEETGCARTIFRGLARRAFRRPVTDADVERLMEFYRSGSAQGGGFEAGIESGLQRLIVSPEFLFRIESAPMPADAKNPARVSDLELASRLSFFLWSSIPDDELLDLAAQGKMRAPGVLEAQVRRMLRDARVQRFVGNFVGQWLYLRNVPSLARDPERDPDFDDGLRSAFRKETELFIDHLVKTDGSVFDLLTADYSFVNERLATHYGIPNVKGDRFRRVSLPGPRRGLLGQGSILSVTSHPDRTSPVMRGKWILENILGTPPPQPPPNVPALQENNAAKPTTLRARMEAHRANPVCASCHKLMDPLGFALENFDESGRYRIVDEGRYRIDATGIFPDGTPIDGPAGLRDALLRNRDAFVSTFVDRLLTYALGRGLEYYDAPAVRAIVRDAAASEYRIHAVIAGIVKSAPFQMRRFQQ